MNDTNDRRPETMTLRAALYARYSSDQQRSASIEDQFRVCREHADREGWKIAGAYRDAAVSGASMILHPGVQALLEDARRGGFDIVVAEALDRVSRDQADVAVLYKHLKFAGASGAGPRRVGKLWTDTSLRGHAGRGTGILNHEFYIGRLVSSCQRFMKNPETGKRGARVNPPEDWIVAPVPERRIAECRSRR